MFIATERLCNCGKRHYYFYFGPVVKKAILLKDVIYFQFWQPFCLVKQIGLFNAGRGHYEEHFCEIRRCHLKIFLGKLYFKMWRFFCLKQWKLFCNIGNRASLGTFM